MSLDDVFDEFEEKKKEDKTVPEESPEHSKESEGEGDSAPKGEDESKAAVEVKTPDPSKTEDADDWFAPVDDKPVEDQPVKETPVKEKADEVSPGEESPAVEAPVEISEDWFEPAAEEPIPEVAPSKPLDMTALESIKVYPIVIPAVTAEAMKAQITLFQSLKASLLDKNQDIATIQGKPFIKRSGWRKFALAFNISDEIIREQKEKQGEEFEWRIWVKVWAPNGRSVVGIGACSSKERDFAHLEHDVYATAHTRAKNRALSDLIGSGEVSWEELRGFG